METPVTPDPVRLRRALEAVPAYVPGAPPEVVEGLEAYKISSNENPYPPLPSVVEAVTRRLQTLNRYPDMGVARLTAALAEHLGVQPENIATGTGSVALLAHLVGITCDAEDEVVHAWRSFEAYPIMVALAGARAVQVPLTEDFQHDLPAMAAAVTERTRLMLVCTPNNPTGPTVTEEGLRELLARVPSSVLVVVDEAYLEFGTDPSAPDALAVWRDHPNVAVLRTFSKAYGLAGLRIGYAVAHTDVATALRKTATPFGVTDLAQEAAIASLAACDELQERVDALVAERTRVRDALRGMGYVVPDTEANFVWLPLGEDARAFADACAARALTVRPFAGEGVRCSIGEVEANDRLLEVAEGWQGSRG